jgi:hypothetical protein
MIRECIAALSAVVLTTTAKAEPLAPANAGLAKVLSSMTVVADYTEDPLVRVILIGDSGECDEGNEARTCPKTQLLIVAAEEVEGPQAPHVWQTPRRIDWHFVDWTHKPSFGSEQHIRAAFAATACEAPPSVESGRIDPRKGGNWRVVRFEIRIDGMQASLKRLSRYADGKSCDLY